MKKLLWCIALISISSYSQKSLNIYNYSAYELNIGTLTTETTAHGYPRYSSYAPFANGNNGIHIAPYGEYILQNPVAIRFPFYSTTTGQVIIDTWIRMEATSGGGAVSSASINTNAIAGDQIFRYMKFGLDALPGSGLVGGGGDLYMDSQLSGPGWLAMCLAGPTAGSVDIYILDN